MPKIKISNDFIAQCNESVPLNLPKYTSQLMNLANQNAGGTRPKAVGQLSELFPEYMSADPHPSIDGWKKWYLQSHPQAIDTAVSKVMGQIENLKKALPLVTQDMVKSWVTDLVIYKTFNGMYFQKAIIAFIAEKENAEYRLAAPSEEAQGIDGYIGQTPVSIKPDTYEYMNRLNEQINVKMIFYSKKKDGIVVNY